MMLIMMVADDFDGFDDFDGGGCDDDDDRGRCWR